MDKNKFLVSKYKVKQSPSTKIKDVNMVSIERKIMHSNASVEKIMETLILQVIMCTEVSRYGWLEEHIRHLVKGKGS